MPSLDKTTYAIRDRASPSWLKKTAKRNEKKPMPRTRWSILKTELKIRNEISQTLNEHKNSQENKCKSDANEGKGKSKDHFPPKCLVPLPEPCCLLLYITYSVLGWVIGLIYF